MGFLRFNEAREDNHFLIYDDNTCLFGPAGTRPADISIRHTISHIITPSLVTSILDMGGDSSLFESLRIHRLDLGVI